MKKFLILITFAVCLFLVNACGPAKKAPSDINVSVTNEGLVGIGMGESLSPDMAYRTSIKDAQNQLYKHFNRAMIKTDALYGLAEGSHSITQLPSNSIKERKMFHTVSGARCSDVKLFISWSTIEEWVTVYYENLSSGDRIKNQPFSLFRKRIINNLY